MATTAGLTLDSLATQSNSGLTLLNVSHCPHVASVPALRHFAAMLGRLDDPSHWLVWTKRRASADAQGYYTLSRGDILPTGDPFQRVRRRGGLAVSFRL